MMLAEFTLDELKVLRARADTIRIMASGDPLAVRLIRSVVAALDQEIASRQARAA